MPRFQNLGEDEIRENHGRLKCGGPVAQVTANEHIRAKGQVMRVAFDAGQGEQAHTFCFFNSARKQVSC
jgi:hypothetical protein